MLHRKYTILKLFWIFGNRINFIHVERKDDIQHIILHRFTTTKRSQDDIQHMSKIKLKKIHHNCPTMPQSGVTVRITTRFLPIACGTLDNKMYSVPYRDKPYPALVVTVVNFKYWWPNAAWYDETRAHPLQNVVWKFTMVVAKSYPIQFNYSSKCSFLLIHPGGCFVNIIIVMSMQINDDRCCSPLVCQKWDWPRYWCMISPHNINITDQGLLYYVQVDLRE